MTLDQYKDRIKRIEEDCQKQKNEAAKEYAFANNPYQIGDNVTDHIGTILIEKIAVSMVSIEKIPQCVYFGTELKKDGTPKVSNAKRQVWQSNIELKK